MQDFLPVTRKEMKKRGWEQADFVYVTGDAYVDHPSFGTAIISRLLESRDHQSAGLEKKGKYPGLWGTQAGISGFCRKYGFHGEPLYGIQKAQTEGFLLTWR